MPKKANIFTQIEEKLHSGLSKPEIFQQLGSTDDVARVLASTPGLDERANYQTINTLLFFIIIAFVLIRTPLTILSLSSAQAPIYLYPLELWVPAAALLIAVYVKKYRGFIYKITFGLSFALLLMELSESNVTAYTAMHWYIWSALNGPLIIGGLLANYLHRKLTPNLGFLGAKTDSNGKYLF